jgi:prevent-host-death family protein
MIDRTQDIQSMTALKRDSSSLLKRMKKTVRPLVLTGNGKAEAVVSDAASYRDLAEHLDAVAGIRRGWTQAKKGLGRSVDGSFDDLEGEG